MKIKFDFVTNSSSANFMIAKEYVTPQQKLMIYNHIDFSKMNLVSDYYDEWSISEDTKDIMGYTAMDNFDMYFFLTEIVGIPRKHIRYEDNQ